MTDKNVILQLNLLYNLCTVHHVTTQNKHQHFSLFARPAVSFPVTQLIVLAETLYWIHCLSLSLSCYWVVPSSPRHAVLTHSLCESECLQAISVSVASLSSSPSLSLSLSFNIWSRVSLFCLIIRSCPRALVCPSFSWTAALLAFPPLH